MKRNNRPYKTLARQLVELYLGDKIVLQDDTVKNDVKEKPKDDKIEMKFDTSETGQIPISIQQKIFNHMLNGILIAAIIFGIVIPGLNCVGFSIYYSRILILRNDIITLQALFIFLEPIINYYWLHILFSIIIFLATAFIIICLYILKICVDRIEYNYLQRNIEKNYNKTARKMKELDEEEEKTMAK
jgi:hypothetical protein